MKVCKGKNCDSINGKNHSKECVKEHNDTILNTDGNGTLNTAGNRNPEFRYAGYKGHHLDSNANEDQIAAYEQGVAAREPRSK